MTGAIGTTKDKFSNRNNYQTGIKYVKFALTLDLFPIYQQIDVSEAKMKISSCKKINWKDEHLGSVKSNNLCNFIMLFSIRTFIFYLHLNLYSYCYV